VYREIMTQTIKIKQITTAKHLGTFDSSQPEWHELRAGKVGGSLVGTIAGLNKWESAYTAWAKFSGLIPDQIPDSAPMEWGRRLESVVLDKFEDDHQELTIMRDVGTWQSLERAYQIANVDGLAVEPDGSLSVIEIKTAKYPDDWAQGVPAYYLTQVQWYLNCLGLQKAYVAVLIGGSDYREFEVEADLFQQSADIMMVEVFLDYVDEGTAPDWDGSTSTHETVRSMHPDISDSEQELGNIGLDLVIALSIEADAKEKALKLKSQALDKMGNAKRGLVNGQHVFSRQSRGTGTPFLVTKKGN
jgi:putative phage-type endonuclease